MAIRWFALITGLVYYNSKLLHSIQPRLVSLSVSAKLQMGFRQFNSLYVHLIISATAKPERLTANWRFDLDAVGNNLVEEIFKMKKATDDLWNFKLLGIRNVGNDVAAIFPYMLKKQLLGTCCVHSTVCLVITAAGRICFSINC